MITYNRFRYTRGIDTIDYHTKHANDLKVYFNALIHFYRDNFNEALILIDSINQVIDKDLREYKNLLEARIMFWKYNYNIYDSTLNLFQYDTLAMNANAYRIRNDIYA
jgi:hypothetical protein